MGTDQRKRSWFADFFQSGEDSSQADELAKPSEGTAHVKYIFLDIVGFTRKRSVETQAELVRQLNRQVKFALLEKLPGKDTIFIPTGDGMAIALINNPTVDAHLQIALCIVKHIRQYNRTSGRRLSFEVRIGLNENVDNIVLDINGRRNVAGAGISLAQRIMGKADGNQILVGEGVHTVLNPREEYMDKFRKYESTDKHGETFVVYQYIAEYKEINTNVPSAFVRPTPIPPVEAKFTTVVAYYVGYANQYRNFLLAKNDDSGRDYVATILLYFLAYDASEQRLRDIHETPFKYAWGNSSVTIDQQYDHYRDLDTGVMSMLSHLIQTECLYPYREHFQGWGIGSLNFAFVKPSALEKVCAEWPDIAQQFHLAPSTS